MDYTTFIHERYHSIPITGNYRYINVYEIYKDHVKLIIKNNKDEIILTVLINKSDFKRVSKYHWVSTNKEHTPCTCINSETINLGKFISNSELNIFGKIKGESNWDYRRNKIKVTGNIYTSIDEQTMKLEIKRKIEPPYFAIFDKEDYSILIKYNWRIDKDNHLGAGCRISTSENNKYISMHRFLLESHGYSIKLKGYRGIELKDNLFDFRKNTLLKNHYTNVYKIINPTTVQLTIKAKNGITQIIFDKEDYERVSALNWICKLRRSKWVVMNSKFGYLKWFILGSKAQKFRYLIEEKDEYGRFDFRKETLLTCLRTFQDKDISEYKYKIKKVEEIEEETIEIKIEQNEKKGIRKKVRKIGKKEQEKINEELRLRQHIIRDYYLYSTNCGELYPKEITITDFIEKHYLFLSTKLINVLKKYATKYKYVYLLNRRELMKNKLFGKKTIIDLDIIIQNNTYYTPYYHSRNLTNIINILNQTNE